MEKGKNNEPNSRVNAAFRAATFLIAAAELKQLPEDSGYEVAFAGRSNAGKSSAINTITGIGSLARTSKTPGRTQQIVFFNINEQKRFVDLPGYGYAQVPLAVKQQWHKLIEGYFQKRQSLRGLVLVMDIRHPLKDFDQQMIAWCEQARLPVVILLTKADKLAYGAASKQMLTVRKAVEHFKVEKEVMLFSSSSRQGMEDLCTKINQWMDIVVRD